MKERPILFSGEMVQAILEGKKTQTRRIIKPEPHAGMRWDCIVVNGYAGFTDGHGSPRPCPYGTEGDRLWVRETWQPIWATEDRPPMGFKAPDGWKIGYPATDGIQEYMTDSGLSVACRPSIFMPRWASRILLEITDIRAQPLNCISEADAWTEGVAPSGDSVTRYEGEGRNLFGKLWADIHGPDSWFENPWVWVVEFRSVDAQQAAGRLLPMAEAVG